MTYRPRKIERVKRFASGRKQTVSVSSRSRACAIESAASVAEVEADMTPTADRTAETRDRDRLRDDVTVTTSTETKPEAIRMSRAEDVATVAFNRGVAARHHPTALHRDADSATHAHHYASDATVQHHVNAAMNARMAETAMQIVDPALAPHLVDAAHNRPDAVNHMVRQATPETTALHDRSVLATHLNRAPAHRRARSVPHSRRTT